LKDLNKFLDENNIIRREEVLDTTPTDFDVRMAQFVDNVPQIVEETPLPSKEKPKKQKRQVKKVTKQKVELKPRKDLIVEMIEKTRYQMLSKEVDYEVFQLMQKQHSDNQKDRDMWRQNMLNVRKDHKSLERKLEVLQEFLEKENE
jgi:hypothetical protein